MEYQALYTLLSQAVQAQMAQPSGCLEQLQPHNGSASVTEEINTVNSVDTNEEATRHVVRRVNIPSDLYPEINFVHELLRDNARFLKEVESKTDTVITVAGRGRSGKQNDEPTHCRIEAYTEKEYFDAELRINHEIDLIITDWKLRGAQTRLRRLESNMDQVFPLKRKVDLVLEDVKGRLDEVTDLMKKCEDISDLESKLDDVRHEVKRLRTDTADDVNALKHQIEQLQNTPDHATLFTLRTEIDVLKKQTSDLSDKIVSQQKEIDNMTALIQSDNYEDGEIIPGLEDLRRQISEIKTQMVSREGSSSRAVEKEDTEPVLHTNIIKAMYRLDSEFSHLNWNDMRIKPDNKSSLLKSLIQGSKFPIERLGKTTILNGGTCVFRKYVPEYVQSVNEICPVGYIKYGGKWVELKVDYNVRDSL